MSGFGNWFGSIALWNEPFHSVDSGLTYSAAIDDGSNEGDDVEPGGDDGDPGQSTDPPDDPSSAFDDHGFSSDHFGSSSLDNREEERMCRATGRTGDTESFDRATGTEGQTSLSEARAKEIQELLRSAQRSSENASNLNSMDPAAAEKPTLGERISGWASDMVNAGFEKSIDLMCEGAEAAKGVSDFAAGVGDFCHNYEQMKQNGGDKFYHCMANCESAERGWGGVLAATCMSLAREALDVPKETLMKGYSISESLEHTIADLRADYTGFRGGIDGTRCYDACRVYPHKQK